MNLTKVFLFPLPRVVYQPVLRKPLNIFEPRYVDMIHRAIEERIPVALCYGLPEEEEGTIKIDHESLPFVKNIAGCGIPTLLQQNPNGPEMLIVLEPMFKVEIAHLVQSEAPFNVALAREIVEFETVFPENFIQLKQLELEFRNWGKTYFTDNRQFEEVIGSLSDPVLLVAAICEFIIENPGLKQAILELDDINDKVKILTEWVVA
jgi:Lon protease-like protein